MTELLSRNWPIVQHPDPILTTPTHPVVEYDEGLAALAYSLGEARKITSGLGVAAPQIGVPAAVFHYRNPEDELEYVLVNPQVLTTEGQQHYVEGCLSLRGVYAQTPRPNRIVVQGYDILGKEREVDAVGPLARIIAHELDHLHGVLFIDRLTRQQARHVLRQRDKYRVRWEKALA